jgi:hypothetical protein
MNSDGTDLQLFNIVKDKNETTNVADREPAMAAKLKDKLLKWWGALPKLKQAGAEGTVTAQ